MNLRTFRSKLFPLLLLASGCTFVIHPVGEMEERARLENTGAQMGYFGEKSAPEITSRALLPDVLRYAEKCNGEVQAAYNDWRAALERVPQAGALENPKLMIGYEFAFDPFNREKSAAMGSSGMSGGGGGEQTDKWSIDRAVLGFSQMFPGSGKRETKAERALFEAMATAERFRSVHYDVRNRVISAYAELLYNQMLNDLERENVTLLRNIYVVGEHQLHAGLTQQVELARLDIEIIRAESVLRATEIETDRRNAELNALLNRHPQSKIGRLGIKGMKLRTESLAKLLQYACCNPELTALQKEVEARGADVVLADLEHLPDFELNLSEIRTMSQMAMFGLTLPLNRERIDAGVREMVASRDATVARLRNQQSNALSRIVIAFAMLRDARRIRDDFEGRVTLRTQDILGLQQDYYGSGTGSFLSTLETQKTLLDLRRLIARARVDEIRSMGEIEMIAGIDLLTFRKGKPLAEDEWTSPSATEGVPTQEETDVTSLDQPSTVTAELQSLMQTVNQIAPDIEKATNLRPLPAAVQTTRSAEQTTATN